MCGGCSALAQQRPDDRLAELRCRTFGSRSAFEVRLETRRSCTVFTIEFTILLLFLAELFANVLLAHLLHVRLQLRVVAGAVLSGLPSLLAATLLVTRAVSKA